MRIPYAGRILFRSSIVVTLSALLSLMFFETAESSNSPHMRVGEHALAPIAFVDFCLRRPERCVSTEDAHQLVLDDSRSRQLNLVNFVVNRFVTPARDPLKADQPWRDDATVGHCADYALTKRSRLIDLGWPASALLLTAATLPSGEGHAVLVVVTTSGDFVLDNVVEEIRRWDALPYSWQRRMSPADPLHWERIISH